MALRALGDTKTSLYRNRVYEPPRGTSIPSLFDFVHCAKCSLILALEREIPEMLDEKLLDEHFDRLGIEPEARARFRWIRENAPIRPVGGGTNNTPVRFSSRKMKFVLEAEAFNTEYAAYEDYDNDENIHEFYPQPCKLRIDYINANGRLVHPDITPDIFVVCHDYFAFVECKTEEELLKLAQEQPNRYRVDEHGKWRSPPAESAAKKLGARFLIRSSKDNNWVALENYEFFCDYLKVDPAKLKIAPDALKIIEARLSESSWLTVSDLIYGPQPVDSDSLYALIVTKKIYFDFQTNRISNSDQALIFRDEVSAKAYRIFARISVGLKTPSISAFEPIPGRCFSWDGKPWQIVNVGDNGISAMPINSDTQATIIDLTTDQLTELARGGKIAPADDKKDLRAIAADEIFRNTNSSKLQIANWRYQILSGRADKNNPLIDTKPRSVAYWRADFRAAEIEFGIGFIGLIPNRDNTQGNHTRKSDPQAYELAIAAYTNYWENKAQRSVTLCHGLYILDCEAQGVIPISLRSFSKIISTHRSHEQTKSRVGEKAAYNEEPPYLVLEYTTPRHGNRPFHIGHIDHTPLPIRIRDKTGKYKLQTIWLTLLIDAYSRYVLAIYLSFDPPSYRSCMMVIRECVRKHARIPHWIVVDNGSDFQSVYFETLIGRLQSHKKDRPKGKPKFGSVIERIFQTTTEQFISNLLGATNDMNPRQIGRDVDPDLDAVWTYERLWVRLHEYLNTVYHRNEHSTLGQPPESSFLQGQKIFGLRQHAFFSYNETFIILTCPSSPKGSSKVQPQGVKINYIYYRCPALDLPGILGSRVDVRYDPVNFGIAYALIDGSWQKCFSEHYAIFQHYTEKQIRISTNHLRLKARLLGQKAVINAKTLAAFLISVEGGAVLGMQQLHDSESSSVTASINTPVEQKEPITSAPPVATPPSPTATPISAPTLLEDF
jgi:putative transposase